MSENDGKKMRVDPDRVMDEVLMESLAGMLTSGRERLVGDIMRNRLFSSMYYRMRNDLVEELVPVVRKVITEVLKSQPPKGGWELALKEELDSVKKEVADLKRTVESFQEGAKVIVETGKVTTEVVEELSKRVEELRKRLEDMSKKVSSANSKQGKIEKVAPPPEDEKGEVDSKVESKMEEYEEIEEGE